MSIHLQITKYFIRELASGRKTINAQDFRDRLIHYKSLQAEFRQQYPFKGYYKIQQGIEKFGSSPAGKLFNYTLSHWLPDTTQGIGEENYRNFMRIIQQDFEAIEPAQGKRAYQEPFLQHRKLIEDVNHQVSIAIDVHRRRQYMQSQQAEATTHQNLATANNEIKPNEAKLASGQAPEVDPNTQPRLIKWGLELSAYDLSICHHMLDLLFYKHRLTHRLKAGPAIAMTEHFFRTIEALPYQSKSLTLRVRFSSPKNSNYANIKSKLPQAIRAGQFDAVLPLLNRCCEHIKQDINETIAAVKEKKQQLNFNPVLLTQHIDLYQGLMNLPLKPKVQAKAKPVVTLKPA